MNKSEIGKVVYPDWITVAQEQLNKKNYDLFLHILADVVVYGEIPTTYDQDTKAYKLFTTLKILPNMKSKMNKYENKLKRKRNENDTQNADNEQCDLGKYGNIEIKEIIEIAKENTYNKSDLMNNEIIEKKMLKEKNEELEKVKASIERYIAKATDLTDAEILQYNNFYINKLKQCTTNDEAQYLASWMVSKVQKARTPKPVKIEQPKPQQTDNDGKITPVKPYENMLTDLPKPKDIALYIDGEKDNLLNQFRTYCQNASNHLFYEQNNPKYQPKVKSHWYWYLNDLFTNYAPILVQAGIDKDIDNAQEHICHIWNNNSSFNIQDLIKAV